MIKTCVYSYWAKPFLEKNTYSNFERKSDLLTSLKLSVDQSRKFFDNVILFGDHEAISQICKYIKFDEIFDDLEILNENSVPSYLYNIAKALVCEKMKEPFVIIENDFYIWEMPDSANVLKSEIIIEDFTKPSQKYFDCIGQMKKYDMNTRPRWYKFAKQDFSIPRKGIYGGTNLKFIGEHASEVIKLVLNDTNIEFFKNSDCSQDLRIADKVYDNWYLGAKIENQNINPFVFRESEIKYSHLTSTEKQNTKTIIKLYEKVKNKLPNFLDEFKSDDKVFDPISNYNYFKESIEGIENVPHGEKKLSFVMALMNRSHQIKQTLIKNLEDNWVDREDVEFILTDINSTDGFREWIREQNLEKYIKCGYLKYFEVDSLDHWHASIGKNTASHQAVGKIIVTLDCDNFTGDRGGKFVIDHFEKNDYNCVMHQFDWNPQNGNFGRIAVTKDKFNELGGYDQTLLPMGYQDWDIIKRAEATGCKYINPTDEKYNRAIVNDGGKDLSMANTEKSHKKMGWVEMNRINKLKCHHNLYNKKFIANEGYYGIRSNVKRIYGEE